MKSGGRDPQGSRPLALSDGGRIGISELCIFDLTRNHFQVRPLGQRFLILAPPEQFTIIRSKTEAPYDHAIGRQYDRHAEYQLYPFIGRRKRDKEAAGNDSDAGCNNQRGTPYANVMFQQALQSRDFTNELDPSANASASAGAAASTCAP